jgi:hypothetical protein
MFYVSILEAIQIHILLIVVGNGFLFFTYESRTNFLNLAVQKSLFYNKSFTSIRFRVLFLLHFFGCP